MATYTGVSDSNGDFSIQFSESYTGGQKVIVTAEKSGAEKSIELFAPSDTTGGGIIQFSGDMTNFPNNIGVVTFSSEVSGTIRSFCFSAELNSEVIWRSATGLILKGEITTIYYSAFNSWTKAKILELPPKIQVIDSFAFANWGAVSKLILPETLSSIGNFALPVSALTLLKCLPSVPPSTSGNSFAGLPSSCVIEVPSSSLSLYKTSPNWSSFSNQMVGV